MNIKIITIMLVAGLYFLMPVFAIEDDLKKENTIQSRIDSVGVDLLNRNKIDERIIFAYDKNEKRKFLAQNKTLTKRQVVLYSDTYKYIQTDDELAAYLSREIAQAQKTYLGMWDGLMGSIEVAAAPKKIEVVCDKRAVDYMVKAGYNPLALIVFINKSCPQRRYDFISRHNLTSKRLARIYEYIIYKYPLSLKNNEYVNNKYYQNFLLSSVENRRLLYEKMKSGSNEELKYE